MRSLLARLAVGIAVVAAPATAEAGGSVTYQAGGEQQVLALLNQIRAGHGLSSLVVSAPLRSAARAHSTDMLQQGYFDHDSPGETWDARIARYVRSPMIGENLALGRGASGSAAGIVRQWMRSEPHRAVILTAGLHRVGLGLAVGTFDGAPGSVLATADFAA
jgi:uncharacterized protein YkwD